MMTEDEHPPTDSGPGSGGVPNIRAVHRVASILELFTERQTITAAIAASQLDLSRSTLHRYLLVMESAGMLTRVAESPAEFGLGELLASLPMVTSANRRLSKIGPAFLQRLSAVSSHTAVIGLWDPHGPVVAHVSEDPSRPVLVTVRVGSRLALNSAQGQIFLSERDRADASGSMLQTLYPAERAELARDIEVVKHDHIAVRIENSIIGIATGVYDVTGLCGTIALVGSATDLPAKGAQRQLLVDTATELSTALGGTHPLAATAASRTTP